jgi:hypothetical protein
LVDISLRATVRFREALSVKEGALYFLFIFVPLGAIPRTANLQGSNCRWVKTVTEYAVIRGAIGTAYPVHFAGLLDARNNPVRLPHTARLTPDHM